ncbi:MAG: ribonuclease HII [Actinobacteria bacterium]|nr:ribonuclease HII [Actinomycetota bacterium]
MFRPPRPVVRRDAGIEAYEAALSRAGFAAVAGADEAGRGACAGPLVVAACIVAPGRRGRIEGLADSKVLTAATRERLYEQVVRRAAAYAVVVISAAEVDAIGLHVANLAGMRRAIGLLEPRPSYALTDGFPVPGLGVPTTAVWKGDAVVACIAAASILAKVTRDRIMRELHEQWPEYDFAKHKGYVTAHHAAALERHGPCPEHRRRYINVQRVLRAGDPVGENAAIDFELLTDDTNMTSAYADGDLATYPSLETA